MKLVCFAIWNIIILGAAQAQTTSAPLACATPSKAKTSTVQAKDDGYRGIWYFNQPSKDEYKYKYSGGFATYPQQHIPIACYSKQANKTFFCYGGTTTTKGKRELLHMVSYYDHASGLVPRPTILLNKKTDDAHDNPTLMIDDKGFIWIFSNSHGGGRPSFIHKSRAPYSVDAFDLVTTPSFSYSQPWWIPNEGFLFLHTCYQKGGRSLFFMTSPDGCNWSPDKLLSRMEMGHYQISWRDGQRVGTAFNMHPKPVGLNARTNLYYLQTRDMGKSWTTADGKAIELPLTTTQTACLVHNYQAEGLLVYLKDMGFDCHGNPVILYLTSKGYESGPKNDPRVWNTARWNGSSWEIHPVTTSDNNYDFGSLYIEEEGLWRIIAPTESGPQPYNPGGEVVMWISRDQGKSWEKAKQLTRDSKRNHTYVRRPLDAHPDFYALWADGDARQPSESCLYFTNRNGDHVWRLPTSMSADFARPEIAW